MKITIRRILGIILVIAVVCTLASFVAFGNAATIGFWTMLGTTVWTYVNMIPSLIWTNPWFQAYLAPHAFLLFAVVCGMFLLIGGTLGWDLKAAKDKFIGRQAGGLVAQATGGNRALGMVAANEFSSASAKERQAAAQELAVKENQ